MATILVVEDDAIMRLAVQKMLESAGHKVDIASNGQEAMRAFEAHRQTLVITDLFMPGRDGFDTIKAVHAVDAAVPILVISAWKDGPDYPTMARKLGARAVLRKPFQPPELLAAVEACLGDASAPGVAGA